VNSVETVADSSAKAADFRVVCALAGPFSGHELPECDAVFVADGGLAHMLRITQNGRSLSASTPRTWQWTGDGDSISISLDDACRQLAEAGIDLSCHPLPVDKDLSDFGAALDGIFALWQKIAPEKSLRLFVLGGLGGRRDHALCNLMEAADVCARAGSFGARAQVDFRDGSHVPHSDHTALAVFTGEGTLHARTGESFSLVPLRGDTKARIEGALYAGDFDFTRGSRGLSNVLTASDGCVRVHTQGVFALALAGADASG